MTFEQAERKLRKWAKDKYCALKYERVYDHREFHEQQCCLYIDGHSWHNGNSWNVAFSKLSDAMERKGKIKEEPPGEELEQKEDI